jgi:hypothetical protein
VAGWCVGRVVVGGGRAVWEVEVSFFFPFIFLVFFDGGGDGRGGTSAALLNPSWRASRNEGQCSWVRVK